MKTISSCFGSRNALNSTLIALLGSVILLSGMIAPAFAVTLNEALDNSSLTFSTGGSATWFGQTSVYSYGGDAAQSGDISDGQTSWLSFQTPYVGSWGNYLRFDWKVSSEERYDMLSFYMDYELMDSIDGEVGWQTEAYYLPASGYHTLEWKYEKDGSVSSGSDAGWVDHVELFSGWAAPIIDEAVDNTALTWSSFFSGSGEAWEGEPFISMYGGDAAQSGSVSDSSYSYLDTGVTGPGTLYFYWKVSSESGDYLIFYIDGVPQTSISGNTDWNQESFNISSGYHTLRWSYKKDVGVSAGSDAGWLDSVEFVPTSVTLGEAVDNTGLTWSTFGSAHWFGQTSTSYYGGDAAQSGNVIDDAYTWIQTTVTGPGTLSFYWKVSSETGYDYLEFYINGALQSEISGEVSWQQKNFSLASGSHTLIWSYSKDRSDSTGSDAGWLDRVQFTTITPVSFNDGFESGSFSAWSGTSVTSGETATVVNTIVHHGTYSAKFSSNGNLGTERAYSYKTVTSQTELYARGYFRVAASGITANDNRFYFLIFKAGSNPVAFAGWRMTGGVAKWTLLIRHGTSYSSVYSTTSPTLNQWYCVELHWKKDAAAGMGELWVDGAKVCSVTGKNTAYYGDVNRVENGLPEIVNCAATTVYSDCVKLSNAYIGPEPTTTMFADGFESGSFNAWTGTSVTSGETANVVNTIAHHGTYSAKFTSNGNLGTERAYSYKTVTSSSELYARGYFRVATSGISANDNRFYLLIFKAGGNPVAFAGWRMTGGVLKWTLLIRSGTGWVSAYSAASPTLSQWYSVELHWKKDTAAGLGELYVNGALACSITGKNTTAYGNAARVEFGLPEIVNCASTTAYCDCIKVATTYIGPES